MYKGNLYNHGANLVGCSSWLKVWYRNVWSEVKRWSAFTKIDHGKRNIGYLQQHHKMLICSSAFNTFSDCVFIICFIFLFILSPELLQFCYFSLLLSVLFGVTLAHVRSSCKKRCLEIAIFSPIFHLTLSRLAVTILSIYFKHCCKWTLCNDAVNKQCFSFHVLFFVSSPLTIHSLSIRQICLF